MKTRTCAGSSARAQSLVEFAFALPVFLVLMLALIDFSRLLFTYEALTDGAREMARSLVINTNTNTQAIASFSNLTLMAAGVNNTSDTVTVSVTTPGGSVSSTTCYLNTSSGGGITLTTRGTSTACTLPSRTTASRGYADVSVSYTFQFFPLFQAPFGVGFVRPFSVLTTTARGYIE